MADKFLPKKRSEIMSHVSGKETKPEILVRKYLFAHGFRYRKNVINLPGKPDIVLRKYKTVVFVHGCFWHGHRGCAKAILPITRKAFWENKISGNMLRDRGHISLLKEMNWNVIVVWQCEIQNKIKQNKRLAALLSEISDYKGIYEQRGAR